MAITSVIFAAAAVVASNLGGLEVPGHQQDHLGLIAAANPPLELAQRQPDRSGVLATRISGSWVNLRSEPTLQSQVKGEGRDGDRVTILRDTGGLSDRYQWYFVELAQTRAQGWVRGDLIQEESGQTPVAQRVERPDSQSTPQSISQSPPSAPVPSPQVSTPRTRTTSGSTPATGGAFPTVSVPRQSPHARTVSPPWHTASREVSPEETNESRSTTNAGGRRASTTASRIGLDPSRDEFDVPSSLTAPAEYTAEEVDYFREIALGSEFGNASQRIRRWDSDINIRVHGNPTQADRTTLANVVRELDDILSQGTGGRVSVNVLGAGDSQQPNVDMYFVPHGEFSRYEPNYRAGNLGFAYVNWSQDKIYKARILVTSTNDISQTERSHLIREELTQSLGLLKDSLRYADSIFYQGWTSTTDYSPLDRAVIQMLYSPEIRPGMDGRQVEAALDDATRMVASDPIGLR
ncbi:MAG: DUF2927 domain-containing protein [Elainellaceae cyanobacterium]